jgi:hypothetical protein
MRHLRFVCLAAAFVALAVPSSAQTSLTPGQSVKITPGQSARDHARPKRQDHARPARQDHAGSERAKITPDQNAKITPGQNAKIYRTVISQGRGRAPIARQRIPTKLVVPLPLPREHIEHDSPGAQHPAAQNNALANDASAVPDAPANTDALAVGANDTVAAVNGALVVPDGPANTATVPAKFSPKNAADDELVTIGRAFKMLTKDERRAIYDGLKHPPTPNIGTKLPPGIELYPVPAEVAARVPQIRDYQYAVLKGRVLLVGMGRIVAGVFGDSPGSEGCR